MVRQGYLATLIAFGVLLAGCGRQTGSGSVDPGPVPGATEASRPLAPEKLVGSWTIADVDDPGAGKNLRLAPSELHLIGSRCGTLGGSWRADVDGVFLADIDSASSLVVEGIPGCESAGQDVPGWLRRVTAYRLDGRGLPVLLDDLARPVARLIPGATPTAGPDTAASELAPPVVTDAARRALAPAAPLPAALTPVDRRRLVGRWAPTDGHKEAYVEFTADGEWRGSDGCNDDSGRWITAAGGTLLATAGAVTLAYCAASVPVGAWLWTARRAGFEGDVLVLLDAQRKEAGRLRAAD
ncbi:META domain-containing protein [Micromonospora rubida]|uniref:META domain-containing protein n=1 Tax=Micromonospora rubida TaxID=2697657 RepID=UPI0013770A65|nr:META domain-containing protein [Micromonospora rubida]NBE82581.1 META domain-containing protein [Micromonospora rubida]